MSWLARASAIRTTATFTSRLEVAARSVSEVKTGSLKFFHHASDVTGAALTRLVARGPGGGRLRLGRREVGSDGASADEQRGAQHDGSHRCPHSMPRRKSHAATVSVSAAMTAMGQRSGAEPLEPGAFEIDLVRHVDRVAQRVDEGQDLESLRHVADRRGQARKQRERHHDDEGREHRLLHVGDDGGQHEPNADRRHEEQEEPGIERDIGAGERNLKPELRHQQDQRRLHQPDQHGWKRLAEHDLGRPERRHQELIERALLALARHRHRGEQHGLQQRQRADQRRYHEPARLEIGVVPGAHRGGERSSTSAVIGGPVAH